MGAALLRTPELMLDQPEANMLAQNTANVLRHYPSVQMPAQMVDWVALMMAAGTIYGPRMIAIRNNRMAARRAPPQDEIRADTRATATVNTAPSPAPQTVHAPTRSNGAEPLVSVSDIPGLPGVRILRPQQ